MKKIYFLLILLLGISSLKSQDPDLYRSWNLRVIYYEIGPPIFMNDVEPEIHPYIVFDEDNSFTGHGACSMFSGMAGFTKENGFNFIHFNNVNFPETDCGGDVLNQIDHTLREFISNDYQASWGVGTDPETGNLGFILQHGFADSLLFETMLDSELFDTWYLQEIQIEMNPTLYIEEYNPVIAPTLTLRQDMSYEAMAACNLFLGSFSLNEEEDDLFFTDFISTAMDCETQDLNDFETIYSRLFSGEEHFPMWLWHNNQTGEPELWFGSSTGIAYRFTKTPLLGVQNFDETSVKIYPNPASDFLMIKNAKPDSGYKIFDLNGKLMRKGKLGWKNKIDVSTLEKGSYILQMENLTYKFIKK